MVDELVVGSTEPRVAGLRAPARAVDQALRVLDAQPDGERLGLDRDAGVAQHRERVARAVPRREDDVFGGERRAVVEDDAGDAPRSPSVGVVCAAAHGVGVRVEHEADDPAAEAHVAAERDDLGAHLLDHRHQAERADVRLGDPGDLVGRAGGDELGDHLAR